MGRTAGGAVGTGNRVLYVTLLPKAPVSLLRFDAIQIQRPTANATATAVTYATVWDGRGTTGLPLPTDFIYTTEADRSTEISQTLALELGVDIRTSDRVVTPRGTFTVATVAQHRLHQRATLVKVG